MVTTEEMRMFALDCLRWAEEADNASHRNLMIQLARTWMQTASSIERHLSDGGALASADLRTKLD